MPIYHAGPMTDDEFAETCFRSGGSGTHVCIHSGLSWCRHFEGWLAGLLQWYRLDRPSSAKEAKSLRCPIVEERQVAMNHKAEEATKAAAARL